MLGLGPGPLITDASQPIKDDSDTEVRRQLVAERQSLTEHVFLLGTVLGALQESSHSFTPS